MKRHYSAIDTKPQACLVERSECPGGVVLVNATKVAKKSSPNDLVDLAKEIHKADTFIKANACNKLQVIVQQVRYLQKQAHEILLEAEKNAELHKAACNFIKVPGNIYHLYERPSGQKYFSMLSPEEWNSPHTFHGSYLLEADHSWTDLKDMPTRDLDMQQVQHIISSQNMINLPQLTSQVPMDL